MTVPWPETAPGYLAGPNVQRGFTLLEIMIVVVILGILVSIFTLSLGSFADSESAEQARRLEALVLLASEEAAIQGREFGLTFYQHGYEFARRELQVDPKGLQQWLWVPVDDDNLLKPRNIAEEYTFDLVIDKKEADLLAQRPKITGQKPYKPQIFLLSSGEITPPFQTIIRQSFNDEVLFINVAADGKIEIKADDL